MDLIDILFFAIQGQGHVYKYTNLPTEEMDRNLARLYSSYIKTDGKCVALYYWRGGGGRLRLQVRGQDYVEHTLVDAGLIEIHLADDYYVSQTTCIWYVNMNVLNMS